jgi:hypothetical protein
MYHPVIMEMLAREKNRRIQEEIRQIQLLNTAEYKPLGFFRTLRSWISRFQMRHIDQTTTNNESSRIHQPNLG